MRFNDMQTLMEKYEALQESYSELVEEKNEILASSANTLAKLSLRYSQRYSSLMEDLTFMQSRRDRAIEESIEYECRLIAINDLLDDCPAIIRYLVPVLSTIHRLANTKEEYDGINTRINDGATIQSEDVRDGCILSDAE